MTVDESIKQLINAQLAEQLGGDYNKFRNYIDILNKTNKNNSDEINKLKSDIGAYSGVNEKIKGFEQRISKVEAFLVKLNETQGSFGQQTNGKIVDLESKNRDFRQKITDLETRIATIWQNYQKLEKDNNANTQRISSLESKNRELSQKISEKEIKSNVSPSTVRPPSRNESFDQTDNVINSFNNWASYPSSNLPGEFTYVTGDFRIRTDRQEFTETREETKWIINRRGTKTYLLPNPNSFNQMTNLDLYEMDLSMLKEKGKNKIKIITACEISSSGFIEFPGKLQILN